MRWGVGVLVLLSTGGGPLIAQGPGRMYSIKSSITWETGWPFSTVETVEVATVDAEVAFLAGGTGPWRFEMPVAVLPLVVALDNPLGPSIIRDGKWYVQDGSYRGTSWGVGVRPLGFRVVRQAGPASLFAGVGAGLVLFDKPTPAANARKLNYLATLDCGVAWHLRPGLSVLLAYRMNHLSNANGGEINPGIDSHMASLGVQWH